MSRRQYNTPANPNLLSPTDWARATPRGSDYVHVDPKHKGSPVVIVGVASPTQMPAQLRSEWTLQLDQHLSGQSVPPAKAILKMSFIGKRQHEWPQIRQAKVVQYNEARRSSLITDRRIKSCDTELDAIEARDKESDKVIEDYEGQIKQLEALIAQEKTKKQQRQQEVYTVQVERSSHMIEKTNRDNVAVGCLLEIGTIDHFLATPRVDLPFGQNNDVGQHGWARAFGKNSRADCLEDNRDKAKFNLIAFLNMGGTTSQTYLDLFTNPKICTRDEWAVQMGTRTKKINICHDTRSKVFGLTSDPKELQHRNASLFGFPLGPPGVIELLGDDLDDLIDSETEE